MYSIVKSTWHQEDLENFDTNTSEPQQMKYSFRNN